jgi:uncharacterized protein YfeS
MDKATLKKFELFKKEFQALEIHYHYGKDKIRVVKNAVAIAMPGEALIIIKDDKITTVNWFCVIEFTCKMNERAVKMAVKTLESMEENEKMFNRVKDPRNLEVG